MANKWVSRKAAAYIIQKELQNMVDIQEVLLRRGKADPDYLTAYYHKESAIMGLAEKLGIRCSFRHPRPHPRPGAKKYWSCT